MAGSRYYAFSSLRVSEYGSLYCTHEPHMTLSQPNIAIVNITKLVALWYMRPLLVSGSSRWWLLGKLYGFSYPIFFCFIVISYVKIPECCDYGHHQGYHKCLLHMKNYPTLIFMLPAVAATTDVSYACSSVIPSLWKFTVGVCVPITLNLFAIAKFFVVISYG